MNKVKPKDMYDAGQLKVIDVAGSIAVQEPDVVVCIPYLTEKNSILLKYENVPAFELVKPEIDKYVNAVAISIDNGETPKDALRRGLLAEFGLQLKDAHSPEILTPIFIKKNNTSRYHVCILPLMSYDYEQVQPNDELTMKSSNLVLNINELSNVIIYDLITRYAIDLFKKEYSLF